MKPELSIWAFEMNLSFNQVVKVHILIAETFLICQNGLFLGMFYFSSIFHNPDGEFNWGMAHSEWGVKEGVKYGVMY